MTTTLYVSATPSSTRFRRIVEASAIYYGVFFLASVAFSIPMLWWIPLCRDTFKDFHIALPAITVLVLNLSDFFCNEFGWVLIAFAAIVFPIPLGMLSAWSEDAGIRRSIMRAAILLLAVFTIAAVVFLVIAMKLPMMALTRAV